MLLNQAYDRVKAIDWDPTYITKAERQVEATRFHLEGLRPVDPFKTFVRDYIETEHEKENRHYAILEASSRLSSGAPEARWMEAMKFGLANLVGVEYMAARQMGRMTRSVAPMELRQGYMMQMLDEMRHSNLEMNVIRHHMRSWRDPSGYDIAAKAAGNNVGAGIFRSMAEDLMTSDPVETSLGLQVFIETAYSNVFFVGLSSAAAAQGDNVLTSTMLTIQSDEARHMANGWATLTTLIQDDRNIPLIQDALEKWSWRTHVSFGLGNMLFADYFVKNRTESAKEQSMRWVFDEFYGGFYQKLEKYGIQQPRHLETMMSDLDWMSHSAAVYMFGAWPVFFHRMDPLTDQDIEWFEKKYPGFDRYFGPFWRAYGKCKNPADRALVLKELGGLPNFCEVCQRPLIFPRPDISSGRTISLGGHDHVLCSDGCEDIYRADPTHYAGSKSFYDLYEGQNMADVVRHLGYVRPDGITLMAQPELDAKRLWTLDDVRACDFDIVRPAMPPMLNRAASSIQAFSR